ncbi:MAG: DUF2256 domain-containing protein [Bacteroidota bacterium]
MRGVSKSNLPVKTCVQCQRPYTWRKKWARDWDSVLYCSERCRRQGRKSGGLSSQDGGKEDHG